MTKKLSSEGYVIRHINSDRDYAKFKRQYSAQLQAQHDEAQVAKMEFEQNFWAPYRAEARKKFLETIESFSPESKQEALEIIREGDRRDYERYQQMTKPYNSECYVESREVDASNRLPHNDPAMGIPDSW